MPASKNRLWRECAFYPEGASARIISEGLYRRDSVMRGCIFADSAFLWSRIGDFLLCDNRDRIAFELGRLLGSRPCWRLHCRLERRHAG